MLLVLKYLPLVLSVIEAVTNIIDAIKSRKKAEAKRSEALESKQQTSVEDKKISQAEADLKVNRDKLIGVLRGLLPEKMQAKMSMDELKNFGDKVHQVVLAVIEAIEAGMPLLS